MTGDGHPGWLVARRGASPLVVNIARGELLYRHGDAPDEAKSPSGSCSLNWHSERPIP